MGQNLVGLVRVSTDRQGESGLGLGAQEAAIEAYRAATGGTLLKTYVEVESGMHDDVESRPQLRAAVAHARRADAVLIIAKIDRMVRSTVVMAYLKTSKVRFVAWSLHDLAYVIRSWCAYSLRSRLLAEALPVFRAVDP
jgi:DNA invertase Pin-like site-specific DNA recombinase